MPARARLRRIQLQDRMGGRRPFVKRRLDRFPVGDRAGGAEAPGIDQAPDTDVERASGHAPDLQPSGQNLQEFPRH